MDNDYFDLIASYWDTEKNREEGKDKYYVREGPKLKHCDHETIIKLWGKNTQPFYSWLACISDDGEEVSNQGNKDAGDHRTL